MVKPQQKVLIKYYSAVTINEAHLSKERRYLCTVVPNALMMVSRYMDICGNGAWQGIC